MKYCTIAGAGVYYTADDHTEREPPPMQATYQQRVDPSSRHTATFTSFGEESFRVSFVPGGIEVAGRITNRGRADELVAAIQALRLLLTPTVEIARPNDSEIEKDDL